MKKHASAPLLTSLSQYEKALSPIGKGLLDKDILAAHFYSQAAGNKFGVPAEKNEFTRKLIII